MNDVVLPSTIACLSTAEGFRDFGTNCHARRVSRLVQEVGAAAGIPQGECNEIAVASLLHDIGKLAVPLELLNKPSSLSGEEFSLVKTHAARGHSILAASDDRLIKLASEIALHHHERYDGSGYPGGFSGNSIPRSARVVAVCDIYDALRETRPYRRSLSHDEAVSKIVNGDERTRPHHFDPRVLTAFSALSGQIKRLYEGLEMLG
jgi:putative two-component system response regulator